MNDIYSYHRAAVAGMVNLITTTEAGALMGLGPHEVRRLCRAGLLPAQRVGRDWLLKRSDVKRYQRIPPGHRRTAHTPR